MARKNKSNDKQVTRRTERMPSGAQQYVRGETRSDRMRTLNQDVLPSLVRRGGEAWDSGARRMEHEAFLDESEAATRESRRSRNYAKGGMVGMKPVRHF